MSHAEVDQTYVAVITDTDVLRLDVSVSDVMRVKVHEGSQHLV